jgi:hypothetical protein
MTPRGSGTGFLLYFYRSTCDSSNRTTRDRTQFLTLCPTTRGSKTISFSHVTGIAESEGGMVAAVSVPFLSVLHRVYFSELNRRFDLS